MKTALLPVPLLLGCTGIPTPLAPSLAGSIGVPHNGVMTESVELPKRGEGFVRYRQHSPHYWGNPRLIEALKTAAATVARELPGGAPVFVGDLSARRGGKIAGHRSHRVGRDADLLLYVATPSGAAIPSPGFVRLGSDGLGALEENAAKPRFVRLDLERQWALTRALLNSPHVAVQFMFVSRPIEALLIDYARARGEPLDLIWRAETVLLEPLDSTPHDDHVHLRVACTPEEMVFGCQGGGPYWEWLPALPALAPPGEAELSAIAAEDPFELEAEASAALPTGDGV
jgi:penicillin-insensitive murein endopeptidase